MERYDGEPQTGEGRNELTERAKEAEAEQTANWPPITSLSLVRRHLKLPSYLLRRRSSLGSFSWSIRRRLGIVGAGPGLIAWLAPTTLHL